MHAEVKIITPPVDPDRLPQVGETWTRWPVQYKLLALDPDQPGFGIFRVIGTRNEIYSYSLDEVTKSFAPPVTESEEVVVLTMTRAEAEYLASFSYLKETGFAERDYGIPRFCTILTNVGVNRYTGVYSHYQTAKPQGV